MRFKTYHILFLLLLLSAVALRSVPPAFAAVPSFGQIRRAIQQHIHLRVYQSTLADKIESRFTAHKTRIQDLMSRIESRIQKMKSAGTDTTLAENQLTTAKVDLDLAIASQSATVQKLHDLSNQKGKLSATERAEVKSDILGTQKSYVQVVKDLRLTIDAMKMAK